MEEGSGSLDSPPPPQQLAIVRRLDIRRDDGGYTACISLVRAELGPLLAIAPQFLCDREQAEFAGLAERRRQSFLLGRYCAKTALCSHTGTKAPGAFWIDKGVFGFPLVRGSATAGVSLSHSEDWGCALAYDDRHPMGVDIQCVRHDLATAAATQLTQWEQALSTLAATDPVTGAFVVWSIKEALSKVLRTGLMTPSVLYELKTLDQPGTHWEATFRNFAQYRALAFALPGAVLAIALPARSRVDIAPFTDLLRVASTRFG